MGADGNGSSDGRPARGTGTVALVAGVLAVLALLVLVRAILAMGYLTVRFAGEIDPLSRAVSYYVFVEQGAGVFTGVLVTLALATVAILVGMIQLRIRPGARVVALVATWCVALVLCAAFPTDDSPRVETAAGWVHQFAGASLFITLPFAGFGLAHSLRAYPAWVEAAPLLRRLSMVAAGLALGYLATRLPDLLFWWHFPEALDWRAVSGLVQRVLFAAELALLLVLAVHLFRTAVHTHRDTRRVRGHDSGHGTGHDTAGASAGERR